jgi:hypothetical protein
LHRYLPVGKHEGANDAEFAGEDKASRVSIRASFV